MGAIWRGHKQYFVEYESDKKVCGRYTHPGGSTSTLNGAKSIIRRVRKELAEYNPRNFKVFDCLADVDPVTGHVPCVYEEV